MTRQLHALRAKNGAPLKGLVLDLRNNPGGVLEAAVAVADAFLNSGRDRERQGAHGRVEIRDERDSRG